MDAVLVVVMLVAMWAVPILVLLVPPIVMSDARRWSIAAAGLWLAAVASVVAWGRALVLDMDHADATGGAGSILAGVEWSVVAVGAATASVVVSRRQAAAASGTLGR